MVETPGWVRSWVAALRSGKYEQGKGKLRSGKQYCPLGVLCDISNAGEWLLLDRYLYQIQQPGQEKVREDGYSLPSFLVKKYGINQYGHFAGGIIIIDGASEYQYWSIPQLSDGRSSVEDFLPPQPFNVIADVIEQNWSALIPLRWER